ncbi:MAG: hypothetical protein GY828_03140 [Candidatus Gracilibacteria bacterium]|nr:hypothetical protein [Candidatus Gracilibacteria bacterium]
MYYSHLGEFFGFENLYQVSGSYEYTKVSLFNFFGPLFAVFLGFKIIKKETLVIQNPVLLISISLILIFSTYFASIPFVSLFGSVEKGHGMFFFFNLILLYITLSNINRNNVKKIFSGFIVILSFVCIYGIYEYFFPSFDYGSLSNRLVSSLGHPNYVGAVLLVLIPYSCENILTKLKYKYKNIIFGILFILGVFTLILTKSALAIFLIFTYFLYKFLLYFCNNYNVIQNNFHSIVFGNIILIILLGILLLSFYAPEKFSSFISRYYIWETSFKIIFSDIKIFFLGVGPENMKLYFDIFKSPELYLYENIGFTADRTHNIFLQFWVDFGILGFLFICSVYYRFYKFVLSTQEKIKKYNWMIYSGISLSIFYLIHPISITGYISVILLFTLYLKDSTKNIPQKYSTNIFFIGLIILSFISSYFVIHGYKAEISAKQNDYEKSLFLFPFYETYYYHNADIQGALKINNGYKTEGYFLENIYTGKNILIDCDRLTKNYASVENYFYCGQIIDSLGHSGTAIQYYKTGIQKFPDVWNPDSKYLQNFPGKYIIQTERILHPKYSNIQEILKKLDLQ